MNVLRCIPTTTQLATIITIRCCNCSQRYTPRRLLLQRHQRLWWGVLAVVRAKRRSMEISRKVRKGIRRTNRQWPTIRSRQDLQKRNLCWGRRGTILVPSLRIWMSWWKKWGLLFVFCSPTHCSSTTIPCPPNPPLLLWMAGWLDCYIVCGLNHHPFPLNK